MQIRNFRPEDLESIFGVYEAVRAKMRRNGNPHQWGDSRPSREKIEGDLFNRTGYIVEHEGKIAGLFAFLLGEDPTYKVIEGAWLNDEPYGTIHRLASSGLVGGIFKTCLDFCSARVQNLRIDTHKDNAIMLHLLMKNGFKRCGIIHVDDGTERIAFQKKL